MHYTADGRMISNNETKQSNEVELNYLKEYDTDFDAVVKPTQVTYKPSNIFMGVTANNVFNRPFIHNRINTIKKNTDPIYDKYSTFTSMETPDSSTFNDIIHNIQPTFNSLEKSLFVSSEEPKNKIADSHFSLNDFEINTNLQSVYKSSPIQLVDPRYSSESADQRYSSESADQRYSSESADQSVEPRYSSESADQSVEPKYYYQSADQSVEPRYYYQSADPSYSSQSAEPSYSSQSSEPSYSSQPAEPRYYQSTEPSYSSQPAEPRSASQAEIIALLPNSSQTENNTSFEVEESSMPFEISDDILKQFEVAKQKLLNYQNNV